MSSRLEPWGDEKASSWVTNFEPWVKMTKLIRATLNHDPQQHPHQIRSAAAMIILLCRENVWPGTIKELDEVVDQARRQLVRVKSYFTAEARRAGGMATDPAFKKLMKSIDEEIRMLESRMSDPKLAIPQRPPCTWGDFWSE